MRLSPAILVAFILMSPCARAEEQAPAAKSDAPPSAPAAATPATPAASETSSPTTPAATAPAADDWEGKAKAAFEARDYGKAIEMYHRSLKSDPDNKELRRARGMALLGDYQFKPAIEDFVFAGEQPGPFEEALKWVPTEDEPATYPDWIRAIAVFQVGQSYAHKGNHSQALKMYNAALKIKPFFPECMAARAYCCTHGYTTRARKDAFAAIAARPNSWEAWRAFSDVLHKEVQHEKSKEAADIAIALAEKSGEPSTADLVRKLKRYKETLND